MILIWATARQGLTPLLALSIKELWVNICPPLEDPLPDYGPVGSVNRRGEPVLSLSKETRTPGGSPEASKCGEGEFKPSPLPY